MRGLRTWLLFVQFQARCRKAEGLDVHGFTTEAASHWNASESCDTLLPTACRARAAVFGGERLAPPYAPSQLHFSMPLPVRSLVFHNTPPIPSLHVLIRFFVSLRVFSMAPRRLGKLREVSNTHGSRAADVEYDDSPSSTPKAEVAHILNTVLS